MTKAIYITIMITTIVSGCNSIQSIYPFYKLDQVVEIDQCNGKWLIEKYLGGELKPGNGGAKVKVKINKNDFHIFIEDDEQGKLEFVPFKIGSETYCDMSLVSKHSQFEPVFHSLSKLVYNNEKLLLIPLSKKWVKNKIKSKEVNLKMSVIRTIKNKHVFLDSPPEVWMEILLKYVNEQEMFSRKHAWVMRKINKNNDNK
jgi:hypothetical protein